VILGLTLVYLADRLHLPWLRAADPIAALFVGGVVIYVSWRLARQTADALLDAAPAGIRQQILNVARRIPGVLEVNRARIRRGGNRYFVDLNIGLARTVTFQRSEQVAAEVTRAVRQVLADADVVVHTTAQARRGENIFDRVRAVATRNNLNVHDISVQALGHNHLHLEQHLELDEKLSLREAHNVVTQLESEMRNSIPEVTSILTHIESEPATIESVDQVKRDSALEARLQKIAAEFRPVVLDVHDVRVKRVRGRIYVSCHSTMQDNLPLARVHDLATEMEIRFKQENPELFRVLIHTEPQTDNARGFDITDQA
jgi:divalent metal cation (Fe/Co/Zn/Cd) transporter